MATAVSLKTLATGVEWQELPGGGVGLASSRRVFVYLRGTTTQVQVYSDQGLSVLLSQPLTTGADGTPGAIPGWIAAEQAIDFHDVESGETVQAEPLTVADLIGSDGKIGGAGSLGFPVDIQVLNEAPLNPLWSEYGAKFDGSTDDTAAWTALFAALPSRGGEIYVPPVGTSIVSQITVPINSTDVTVRGGGSRNSGGSCRLLSHYAGSGNVVTANAAAGLRWTGVSIYNDASGFTGKLLNISRGAGSKDTTQWLISDCRLQAVAQAGSAANLLQITKATIGTAERVYFYGGAYGVEGLTAGGDYCNTNTIGDGCLFSNQDLSAVHNLGDEARVMGVTFEPLRSGAAGAYIQDAARVPTSLTFFGNWTGDSDGTGTWFTVNAGSITFISNKIDPAATGIVVNADSASLTCLSNRFNGQATGVDLGAKTFSGEVFILGQQWNNVTTKVNTTSAVLNSLVMDAGTGVQIPKLVGQLTLGANGTNNGSIFIDSALSGTTVLAAQAAGDSVQEFVISTAGQMQWGTGSSALDTTLQRAAAGVLRIVQSGGGLRLTSPDGTKTKTLTIDNTGALIVS